MTLEKSKDIIIEPLHHGFMASLKKYVGVGETEEIALQRLFEKLPAEKKNAKT